MKKNTKIFPKMDDNRETKTTRYNITYEILSSFVGPRREKIISSLIQKFGEMVHTRVFFSSNHHFTTIRILCMGKTNIFNIYYQKYHNYVHIGYKPRFLITTSRMCWVRHQHYEVALIPKFSNNKSYVHITQSDQNVINTKEHILKLYLCKLIN